MKNLFTILIAVLLTATLWAQSPEAISYQAVIRDANEALVTNQQIGMQISILQSSASGAAVYTETHDATTNANGLISIEIGGGTVIAGDFASIEWGNGVYFLETKTDPTGGTNYTITGVSQLLSVPYALHAKTAETVTGGITEADPVYTSSQAANITATDITNLGNLSGTNTGDQDLSTLATKTALGDSTAQVRSEIPDVSGFLTSETDPTFTSSQAANITATDITNLGNLSGVNTGDQDLSTLATKTALGDSTAQVRSEIPDVSGFLTSETDPIYGASQAASITATDITNLGNLSGVNTGDQDLSTLATKTALGDSTAQVRSEIPDVSGFLTSYTETDPIYGASQAASITATDITNLGNLSGVNTGDQDLSTLATKTALGDSTAQVRSEIPDVSGFLSAETDPTFTSSQAANITATDITNLGNLSGVNTGDQDLSTLATKTALGDSTAHVRSEIPDVSGFLTSETDPTFTNSEAANIDATDITNLGNLSGTNTGDQDLSTLATKTALGDSTAQVRSEIPDVSGFLSAETDPVWQADSSTVRTEVRTEISDSLSILNSQLSTIIDTAAWNKDTSATNELQVISISNDTVYLEKDNYAVLPSLSQLAAINDSINAQIKNVTDPTDKQDAVTKYYADSLAISYGSTSRLLSAGYSVSTLLSHGHTVSELVTAGGSVSELVAAGASVADLVAAGATTESDYIGLFYQGGVIFYVNTTDGTGLVCAVSDASSTMMWSSAFNITNATGKAIGTGQSNTTKIISSDGSNAAAAYYCGTLTLNGYSDWFLPSKGELRAMYNNKDAINETAGNNGGSSFTDDFYWNSTEYGYGLVYFVGFGDGDWYAANKHNYYYVRAVRAF